MIPHFTGPVSEAALVHCLATYSGPVIMEMTSAGPGPLPHLPQAYDFRNGKMWPNQRPGLCVELDTKPLKTIEEWLSHYRQFWEGTLKALADYAEGDRSTALTRGVKDG